MTRWGRAALLALLVVAIVAPAAVFAQAPAPIIESAELRLWPEYDDPGLLVIFSGDFAAGATTPLNVAFPIPAGARNIQATYQDAQGTLINRPFEVVDGKLTYELPTGTFHTEHYVDREPSGDTRQIKYVFEAPYAMNALRVAVQQPARSTDFSLSPAADTTEQGTDGLTYHVFTRQNLAAGEKLEIDVNYAKSDTSLSAPQLSVTDTDAAAAEAPLVATESSPTDWLPWVLIGAGVALLVGILAYWLLSRRRPEPEPEPAARPVRQAPATQKPLPTVPARPAQAQTPPASTAKPAAFCHNCGNALKAEDKFCPQCGTPRRQ
ncbi:MAG: zinc ribbon domain-containing protein [Anaerolineae bacterium]|jgi:hypothetical protein|nr:zinc ribbon domain-containing protein [Anaerolineae bacterium]